MSERRGERCQKEIKSIHRNEDCTEWKFRLRLENLCCRWLLYRRTFTFLWGVNSRMLFMSVFLHVKDEHKYWLLGKFMGPPREVRNGDTL